MWKTKKNKFRFFIRHTTDMTWVLHWLHLLPIKCSYTTKSMLTFYGIWLRVERLLQAIVGFPFHFSSSEWVYVLQSFLCKWVFGNRKKYIEKKKKKDQAAWWHNMNDSFYWMKKKKKRTHAHKINSSAFLEAHPVLLISFDMWFPSFLFFSFYIILKRIKLKRPNARNLIGTLSRKWLKIHICLRDFDNNVRCSISLNFYQTISFQLFFSSSFFKFRILKSQFDILFYC